MKRLVHGLLLALNIGLLTCCQEITPLAPPNPVVGTWTFESWQTFHLPAWYVAYSHADYVLTPTDTVYGPMGEEYPVRSFTFAQNNIFQEQSAIRDWATGNRQVQTDSGLWSLADSVVTLNVANSYTHKLTYRYATDHLVTDRVAQTALIRRNGNAKDTVRISYQIRVYYRRSDP